MVACLCPKGHPGDADSLADQGFGPNTIFIRNNQLNEVVTGGALSNL